MQDCLSDILHMPHVLSHVNVHTCAISTHGRLTLSLPYGTQALHMVVRNDVHAKSAMHLWGLQALETGQKHPTCGNRVQLQAGMSHLASPSPSQPA